MIRCERFIETTLQVIVTDTAVTETDGIKITSCYMTEHEELASGHCLMC